MYCTRTYIVWFFSPLTLTLTRHSTPTLDILLGIMSSCSGDPNNCSFCGVSRVASSLLSHRPTLATDFNTIGLASSLPPSLRPFLAASFFSHYRMNEGLPPPLHGLRVPLTIAPFPIHSPLSNSPSRFFLTSTLARFFLPSTHTRIRFTRTRTRFARARARARANAQSSNTNCAKDAVSGCSTNPASCSVCQGKGCAAMECTGWVSPSLPLFISSPLASLPLLMSMSGEVC